MKKILQLKLKTLAKLILKKYQPVIIGITGSLGKTSAKEAITAVLHASAAVRMSQKNYNNEFGLPLTIIGADSAGHDFFGWVKVFALAGRLLLIKDKNYPRILVLEMGVDRPGDMAYLTEIAPPSIGIVTAVSYSHLEYFGELVSIKKEKQVLIDKLNRSGTAILNYDNAATQEMAETSRVRTLTYGLGAGADLQAQDIVYNGAKGNYELNGLSFKLNYKGSVVPVFMTDVMATTAIYAALAAAAVGVCFDLNLVEIAQALKDFSLPQGRMKLLPGLKNSFIIDDTYNSSPEAAMAALETMGRFKIDEKASKYAVFGDMLELGSYTEEGHRLVGEAAAKIRVDCLIAVGEKARDIVRSAAAAGLDDDCLFCFDRTEEAGKFLQNRIKAGDVILIKGSQGARMEKVVKEIMAEPEQAETLLVRQGSEWK